MRVVVVPDDGAVELVDVEAPASTLRFGGKIYERFEVRNAMTEGTKAFVYASRFPSANVTWVALEAFYRDRNEPNLDAARASRAVLVYGERDR